MNDPEVFNIERTDTIDSLAFDDKDKVLILLLTDGMDWTDPARHMNLLKEKLNNYIFFIDTEQYSEKYPDTKMIEWRIQFYYKEPEVCQKLLEYVIRLMNDKFDNVEVIVEHGTEE